MLLTANRLLFAARSRTEGADRGTSNAPKARCCRAEITVGSIQVPKFATISHSEPAARASVTRMQLAPRNTISQRSAPFDAGKSPCRVLIGWSVGADPRKVNVKLTIGFDKLNG